MTLQVERIQISAVLENYGVGTQARPHDIEFVELSKLFDLLTSDVVTVEIQPVLRPAIGGEINRVSVHMGNVSV